MLEAQVAYYLNLYLGRYVHGIDAESLRISVWKGDVELRNLQLRPEALQQLDLPITVKAGLLGRLTLKVPWARLGQQPVTVEFDRLYIIAGPRTEQDQPVQADVKEYADAAHKADVEAKLQRVDTAEQSWLQGLAARAEAAMQKAVADAAASAVGSGQASTGSGAPSTKGSRFSLQSMIETILGNLQLVVTNVHVRYEDEVAWPGHSLSLGVLLDRLAAQTVDEQGRPAWVPGSLRQLLRKAINLSALAVYLDIDCPMVALPRGITSWTLVTADQWDALFLPLHHNPLALSAPATVAPAAPVSSGAGSARAAGLAGLLSPAKSLLHQHDFLVRPVSGSLRYTRRGRPKTGVGGALAQAPYLSQPRQEWRLTLEEVSVCLSDSQYSGAQCLAEYMDALARSSPHRSFRPTCRPRTGVAARIWWYYAISSVQQEVRRSRISWMALRQISAARKQYVAAYAAWLEKGGQPGACPDTKEWDEQLTEQTLLQFRRMAHAKAGTTNPAKLLASQKAGAASNTSAPGSQQTTTGTSGRTWAQWLGWQSRPASSSTTAAPTPQTSTSTATAATETGVSPPSTDTTPASAEMTAAEWAKLEDLLHQQDENLSLDLDSPDDSPHQLRTTCMLNCKLLQLQLTRSTVQSAAASGSRPAHKRAQSLTAPDAAHEMMSTIPPGTNTTIACASAHRLQLGAQFYKVTRAVQLDVGRASITCPQGDLFHVGGVLAPPSKTGGARPTDTQGPSAAGNMNSLSITPSSALSVSVVQAPQDGHVDVEASVHIAPSFVTWLPEAVAAVTTFFTPQRELELEALQAQAAVQSEALWRLASMRVAALSEAQHRPKVDLHLCAHAPKLALPHPDGRTVLILDLGRLQLKADRDQAASLPGEQASLYDCMSAQLESLAAYLLLCPSDTKFVWPHLKHLQDLPPSEPPTPTKASEAADTATPALDDQHAAQVVLDALDGWGFGMPLPAQPPAPAPPKQADTAASPVPPTVQASPVGTAEQSQTTAPVAVEDVPLQPALPQPPSQTVSTGPATIRSAATTPRATSRGGVFLSDSGWDLASLLTGGGGGEGDQPPANKLMPLLERFSLEGSLQIAQAVHPRYPKFRVSVSCSRLHLHISPALYHRLMLCVASLTLSSSPPSSVPQPGTHATANLSSSVSTAMPGTGTPIPPWLSDPELQTQVSLLDWVPGPSSTAPRKPHWQTQRVAYVWRGRLYITPAATSTEAQYYKAYWQGGWRLMALEEGVPGLSQQPTLILAPREAVDAAQAQAQAQATGSAAKPADVRHSTSTITKAAVASAVAKGPGQSLAWALSHQPGCVVVTLGSVEALSKLHAAMARSRSTMQAVAGLLAGDSTEEETADDTQQQGSDQSDMLARMMSHSEVLELRATVSEVVVHCSGRRPPMLTPAEAVARQPSGPLTSEMSSTDAAGLDEPAFVTDPPEIEEEVPLITVRLQAALVDTAYNSSRLHVGAAMRALTVEDRLMGPVDPELLFLAQSGDPSKAASAPVPVPGTASSSPQGKDMSDTGAPGLAASPESRTAQDSDEEFFDAAASWVAAPGAGDSASVLGSMDSYGAQSLEGALSAGTSPAPGGRGLDALAHMATAGTPTSSGAALPKLTMTDTPRAPRVPGPGAAASRRQSVRSTVNGPAEPLVWLSYTSWTTNEQQHPTIKSELVGQLSSLTLRTHRPTVAALMTFGLDMAAVNTMLTMQPANPVPDQGVATGSVAPLDSDEEDSTSVGGVTTGTGTTEWVATGQHGGAPGSISGLGGGSAEEQEGLGVPVVTMRLVLDMRKLELVLPYEGGEFTPFARASMDGFSLRLDYMEDSSMDLHTTLGNLVATCETLPEECPYRTICQLRPGDDPAQSQGSLITVRVTSTEGKKHTLGDRAPRNIGHVYHVTADLQAVQLVYLQCVINHLTDYLAVFLAMGPPPRMVHTTALAQAASNTSSPAPTAQQTTPTDPMESGYYVVLLDIKMGSPLIVMPLSKNSLCGLEIDVGRVELHNSVSWGPTESPAWRMLTDLMKIRLWGCGIVVVFPTGERSPNCIHDLGPQGCLVTLYRHLLVARAPTPSGTGQTAPRTGVGSSSRPPALPAMQVNVSLPTLDIRIADTEYQTALKVLSSNYHEQLALDPELATLQVAVYDRQEALQLAMAEARGVAEAVRPSRRSTQVSQSVTDLTPATGQATSARGSAVSSPSKPITGRTSSARPRGWSHMTAGSRASIPGAHDFTVSVQNVLRAMREQFNMGVTVLVGSASLQLFNHIHNAQAPQGLAKLLVADLWVSYSSSTGGGMFVEVALPVVSIHDMRPGVSTNNSLVFSTTDVATTAAGSGQPAQADQTSTSLSPSLMFLEYRYVCRPRGAQRPAAQGDAKDTAAARTVPAPGTALQAVAVRLQKPTLVLDLAFIMPLIKFVAPSAALSGAVPAPWTSREILLGAEEHQAKSDVWLSPEVRILADAPEITNFVYNGCGHSLFLPPGLHPSDTVPFIIVGPHRTLTLRNVRLVHCESLPACLQLGSEARVVAREEDGVVWVTGSDHTPQLGKQRSRARRQGSRKDAAPVVTAEQPQLPPTVDISGAGSQTSAMDWVMEVQLDAYGTSLHLLDSRATSGAGAMGAGPQLVSSTVGSAGARTSFSKAASSPGPHRQGTRSLSRSGSASSDMQLGAAAAVAGAGGPNRRLVLSLDLSMAGRMQASSQLWQVSLMGLSVCSHSSLSLPPWQTGPAAAAVSNLGRTRPSGLPPLPGPTSSAKVSGTNTPSREQPAVPTLPQAAKQTTSKVLAPCDIAVSYTWYAEGASPAATVAHDDLGQPLTSEGFSGGSTTIALDVSALVFTLSPDVLQLLLSMVGSVSRPLVVPAPTQPVLRCDTYERLWTSAGATGPVQAASVLQGSLKVDCTGRGGVDPCGAQRGMALWRPQPPQGYLSLGDVAVPGAGGAPSFAVAVVAVNSGMVAWPTKYEVCWNTGDGLVLWRAVPPPGYVALGVMASSSVTEPPPMQQQACVREEALVDARAHQCMLLCGAGNLWSVANCGSTLTVAPSPSHAPATGLRDLRMPIAVAPAALTPDSAVMPPKRLVSPDLQEQEATRRQAVAMRALQNRFLAARSALARSASAEKLVITTVEFRRLWWDRRYQNNPAGCQTSFWRPVVPPGYASLGDVLVTGVYAPPQSALVVRDTPASAATLGQAPTHQPLLARPLGYARVWMDEQRYRDNSKDPLCLSFWRPVAPPGYVAMGCVVGYGDKSPVTAAVRCIRADLVASVPLSKTPPSWVQPPYRQRSAVLAWIVDERLGTFVAVQQDEMSRKSSSGTDLPSPGQGPISPRQRLEGWRLKLPLRDEREAEEEAARLSGSKDTAPTSLSVDVRASSCSLLLQSSSRQPLLELGLQEIKSGLGTQEAGVMRGFMFSTVSLWSYSSTTTAWEPVLEPWQVLAHADINTVGRSRAAVSPGTWLRLTSTQSSVSACLSQSTLASLLLASKEWKAMLSNQISGTVIPDGELGSQVEVENALGVEVEVAVDMGGSTPERATIQPGTAHVLWQPLPAPPPSPMASAMQAHSISASLRLLIDILELRRTHAAPAAAQTAEQDGSQAPGTATNSQDMCQLACAVEVFGPLADLVADACWGCTTRVVPTPRSLPSTSNTPQCSVSWDERFLVTLPQTLSDRLLQPVGPEDQFTGVPLALRFKLVAHDRPEAEVLAAATAAVEFDWLVNQASVLRRMANKSLSGTEDMAAPRALRSTPSGVATAQVASAASSHPEQMRLTLPVQCLCRNTGSSLAMETMELHVAVSLDVQQVDLLVDKAPGTQRQQFTCDLRAGTFDVGCGRLGGRLLRLPPTPTWYPLPSALIAPSRVVHGKGGHMSKFTGTSCIAFPLGSGEGAVVESKVVPGQVRQEVLRSLCKVVNATQLHLQVSIVFGSDEAAWTVVPRSGTAAYYPGTPAGSTQIVEEEVFENETFVPLRGWSHTHLLSGDRQRFNRGRLSGGDSSSFPQLTLPQTTSGQQSSWEWEGSWEVETRGHVDRDGWAYGGNWNALAYPFAPGCGTRRPTDLVRRRRWVRRRVLKDRQGPMSGAGGDVRRRVLGVVAPGSSLPLPLGWSTEGCDLQFRPLMADPSACAEADSDDEEALVSHPQPLLLDSRGEALHAWSMHSGETRDGSGSVGVDLSELSEGDTHLMCCGIDRSTAVAAINARTSAGADLGAGTHSDSTTARQNTEALAALLQPQWFSTTIESDALVMAQAAADVLVDWRIVVRPPLILHNWLPVPARYTVWERTGAGGPLRARHQGSIGAWASTPVYTVDMRQQVCLSFAPEGCEFGETEPLLLVEGTKSHALAGIGGNPRLPDSFRCAYKHTQPASAVLRLSVWRDVDLSAEADLEAGVQGSAGSSASVASASAASFSSPGAAAGPGGNYSRSALSHTTSGPGQGRGVLAQAVARGSPLSVRICAAMVVVNNAQVPVSIGLLGLENPNRGDQAETSGQSWQGTVYQSASSMSSRSLPGLDGYSGVKIIDTDQFTNAPRPPAHVTLSPRCLELLSLPPGCNYTSDLQPAVAISCQGSRWCAPIPLPGSALGTAPAGAGVGASQSGSSVFVSGNEPVLVRARSRTDNSVYDLVLRFETGGVSGGLSGLCYVLHIDSHMLVTNRTGYPLQLLQPESWSGGSSGSVSGAGPLGLHAMGALFHSPNSPTRQAAKAPWVLNIPVGAVGLPLVWHPAASNKQLRIALDTSSSSGRPGTPAAPGIVFSEAVPLNQLSVGSQVQILLPLVAVPTSHAISPQASMDLSDSTLDQVLDSATSQPGANPVASRLQTHTSETLSEPNFPPRSAFIQAATNAAKLLLASSPESHNEDSPGLDNLLDDAQALAVGSSGPCWTRMQRLGHPGLPSSQQPSLKGSATASTGTSDWVGVVLVAQLVNPSPGCLTLELISLGAEPAHLVQNATRLPVAFHENAQRCPWQVVGPLSALGYVRREISQVAAQTPLEVELCDPSKIGKGSGAIVAFDVSNLIVEGTGSGQSAGLGHMVSTSTLLRLGEQHTECAAQASVLAELVMGVAGPCLTPGSSHASSSLGGSTMHAELVLRVSALPPRPEKGMDPLDLMPVLGPLPAANSSANSGGWHCGVEISGLELSLVDDQPQELLVATLDGVSLEYNLGVTGHVEYNQAVLKVRNLQIDDMLPTTPYPVVLLPTDASSQESVRAAHDPLMYTAYVVEPGRRRDGLYYPALTWRTLPVRLAVAEPTLWRLLSCVFSLGRLAGSATDSASGSELVHSTSSRNPTALQSAGAMTHEQVQADMPLVINFMNLEDTSVSFSFKPDPSVRHMAQQLLHLSPAVALSLDLVNLEDLALTLPGLYLESVRVHQSALSQQIFTRLQQRLMGMAFSILRNAGVLNSTSKILAVASQGMAQLTSTRAGLGAQSAPSASSKEVGNVGEGVLEGGKALAKGFLAGAVGILAKPMEGAERAGVSGFLEGVGKGVIGAAVNPLSGMFAAAAKFTEGVDATYGRVRETMFSAPRRGGRKRLPRAIRGDHVIVPYSLHSALGQALMHNAALPAVTTSVLTTGLNRQVLKRLVAGGRSRSGGGAALKEKPMMEDCYEEHFIMPDARVLMITNKRVALLDAPEFTALQQSVMSGEVTHVTEVPGGKVVWALPWDGMLTAELAWHQQTPGVPADGVLVHRKQRSPDDNTLVYDLRCRQGSSQAQEVLSALMSTCYRYRLQSRVMCGADLGAGLPLVVSASEQAAGQSAPAWTLSLDYDLVYHTQLCGGTGRGVGGRTRPLISIWRPKGPAGYARLGDVVQAGTDAPSRPIPMYREGQTGAGDSDAPEEGPRLTAPQGYSLIYRDSANLPLTLWRPIPRKGYVEVGCVAWPGIEEPPLTLVRCMRKDLVRPAGCSEAPVWGATSSDNSYWRASMWCVDNHCTTFVAVKGDAKPRMAWAPIY